MAHDEFDHHDEARDDNGADATDDDATDETADEEGSVVRRVDKFRRTATGGMIAAGMLGLQEALEGRPAREEIAVVSEASGQPGDDPLSVELDFDDPTQSRIVVRRDPDET